MNRSCLIPAAALLAAGTFHSAIAQKPAPCPNCGVVESVAPVTRTTQPKGIAGTPVTPGMAIGGVVGGVVGNQIGHGAGNTAATVAGAAGGAYAGHQLEKKKTQQAYVMRIRMQDGSQRTVEQSTPIPKGSPVVVDGKTARLQQRPERQGQG
jgi:outer membrane lipoprotein SlyB